MLETVAFSGQMLDARYLMLDIQECTWNASQKHPDFGELSRAVSRNQYPGSINNATGFRRNSLSPIQYFMQLPGRESSALLDDMNSARKILLTEIKSSLKSLGIPFSLIEERKLPIFQDASELVVIENNSSGCPYYLIPEAARAWEKLRNAANGDGVTIEILSAYRSFQRQFEIVKSKIEKGMSPEVVFSVNAPPGCSEHHTGRAVDIGTPTCIPLDKSFDETTAFSWLQSNAGQFGFKLSYPPSNPCGFEYEPWHWCYQGSSS